MSPVCFVTEVRSTLTPGVPRALFSYSWDGEEHNKWVLALAERLQGESGIQILLDQWYLHPGDDRLHFMEQGVSTSDFVIVVCTPTYAERANRRRSEEHTSELQSPC